MTDEDKRACRILAGGIIALAIALGISRFAYTPLLPLMQRDIHFGDDFAGFLASANYAGYLAGALWAVWRARSRRIRRLRFNLVVNVATTLGMGMTGHPGMWLGLRFISGASSAMVFVLVSGVVLEALVEHRRSSWSGWLYAGIGAGIAVSAALIPPLDQMAGWRGGWLGMAGVSGVFAWRSWRWFTVHALPAGMTRAEGHQPGISGFSRMLPFLTFAYFCEGLGYIVTGTFLVTWLQRSPELADAGFLAWMVVGVAAVPSCVLWMHAGLRMGLATTLVLAHLVQAIGILLPLIAPSIWGALGGAAFFGGTFLGIAALSLVLGRALAPRGGDRVVAVLTAAFGAGQMIGPAVAGRISVLSRSFDLPLYGAASVVVLGAICLAVGLVCTPGGDIRHLQQKP